MANDIIEGFILREAKEGELKSDMEELSMKRSLYDMLNEMYSAKPEALSASLAPKLSPYSGLAVLNPNYDGVPSNNPGWSEKDFEGQGMSGKEMDEELEGIYRTDKRFTEYSQEDLDFFKNQGRRGHFNHLVEKVIKDGNFPIFDRGTISKRNPEPDTWSGRGDLLSLDVRDIIEFLHNVPNKKK
jgi:hypothetical protein